MTSVTDFSQFATLRALSERDRDAALTEVADQFEALFVQQMLKSMRDASFGDPILGEAGSGGVYRDLFDQQIADDIAAGPGIGLADLLVRQLGGTPSRGGAVGGIGSAHGLRRGDAVRPTTPASPRWQTPAEFVADILPHAQKTAQKLGVSPLGVIAQAALETGWGQHVMAGEGGESSLNLFGIKAGGNWRGASVVRDTLEFEGGAMQPRQARFRAYGSLAETFGDYAALLGNQNRYEGVRGQNDDVGAFAEALQSAGYATDPDYAAKIRRVAGGDTMRDALAALKQHDLLSLTLSVR